MLTESLLTLKDGEVILPIENHQGTRIHLDADVELGSIRCSDTVLECSNHPVKERVEAKSTNAPVQTETTSADRVEKLLQILCHPLEKLSNEKNEKLKELIMDFSDVFALDDTELGCTKLIEHTIDTGDHAPI